MVNSKSKGKRGEREAAKLLEAWWGGHFCKTPDSGAFMTVHTKEMINSGNDVSGDLICPSDFPFCVEVKRRKDIDLFKCIRSYDETDGDHLASWWQQCKRDSAHSNKIPLLMFKADRKRWYCGIPEDFHRAFIRKDEKNYLIYNEISIIMLDDLTKLSKEVVLKCIQ